MNAAALPGLIEIPYPFVDPVALHLPFGFAIRWYGISFMVAFGAGYWLMRRLAARGFVKLTADQVGDLLFALILGVILGGRLGYVLFYEFPKFAANPAAIIRIWEGGLSFHGGLAGAVAALAWFGRKHGVPLLRLGDGLSLVATPGIFSVRMANFINGELYGRVTTDAVPWAMRFPTDPDATRLIGAAGARGLRGREEAIAAARESGLWEQVRLQVPLRHPSQLYEGLLEGLVLGLILWGVYGWMRRRGIRLPDGTIGGMFLLGYGLFRSFVELFRQPDVQFTDQGDKLGTVLGPLTMGQTLSMVMIGLGLFLVIRGVRRLRSAPPGAAPV
ncbi:MAG TPA: prolipoprotein diacylglyceryl transferase [Longimicrobium sp.]|uniref:prolipoprotein diacylglyceryl transferase n=1 Tax=Longimicrobium sp. TaxID=2029185 RepID=UPI002EDA7C79